MGILNATKDSFYAASRTPNVNSALAMAEKMVQEGADIIDLGGQSTRPGATALSVQEEWQAIAPILTILRDTYPHILISIDTFYAEIAQKAVALGADIINDVSGGNMDNNMISIVGKLNVPFICMHMQGTPSTMQINPQYSNVVKEVLDYFIAKKLECNKAGIKDVIIDIGFGFGKTMEHNYDLLHNLGMYKNILELPILAGLSRKSMIYKKLGLTADESLNGTTVLNTIAILNGASILRVHDVKEAVQVVNLLQ
jgi:dihydropteroate synthase